MEYQGQLTAEAILKLEKGTQSRKAQLLNRLICTFPLLAAGANILLYKFYPNHHDVIAGNYYPTLIGITAIIIAIRFIWGFFNEGQFTKLREKAALYTAVYLLLTAYDFFTLKRQGFCLFPFSPGRI